MSGRKNRNSLMKNLVDRFETGKANINLLNKSKADSKNKRNNSNPSPIKHRKRGKKVEVPEVKNGYFSFMILLEEKYDNDRVPKMEVGNSEEIKVGRLGKREIALLMENKKQMKHLRPKKRVRTEIVKKEEEEELSTSIIESRETLCLEATNVETEIPRFFFTRHNVYSGLPKCLRTPVEHKSFSFIYIKDNVYVNRRRVELSPDDIPVCNCIPIDGEVCCGTDCFNRLLCCECTPGYCKCGAKCSNMLFQQHKYVNVMPYPTNDDRGYGLITLEDILEGEFIIEYVGEVINSEEKDRRISEADDDSHFYIMQIGPDDYLDASRKGNFARFMNHSCSPNCVPVKWTVQGETRVGLFAKTHIRSGSELTFDYQFERVGRRRQKCLCGAPNCKGYIG